MTEAFRDRRLRGLFLCISVLICCAGTPALSQKKHDWNHPARLTLKQFCELDSKGARLTADGWKQSDKFFVTTTNPNFGKAIVVRDYVISAPEIEGNSALFYVEYIYMGQLDQQARYADIPNIPSQMKVRVEFRLIRTGKDWKINTPSPVPHITIDAAVAHVQELQINAKSALVRRNAEQALKSLKRQRA
jgi:hypothetical protein